MGAGAVGSLGQIWRCSDAIRTRGGLALSFLEYKLHPNMSILEVRFNRLRVLLPVLLRKLRWCTDCSIHGGLVTKQVHEAAGT